MISDWILVALHLLSHTCSTITSELHNTKDKSHNIDNNLSINLLRLLVHPLTLGYCSQTVNSVPGVKDTQEKCQMFFRQICWNIQNYCSQQGLKRTGINKGNCLWCSGDCTLHCLQKQSTPELTVQFGLKKPQTNKKPKLKLTPPTPPKISEPLSICLPLMMMLFVFAQLQTLHIPTVTFRNFASSLTYITFDNVTIFKFSNRPYCFT